jgi:hypothetical protein
MTRLFTVTKGAIRARLEPDIRDLIGSMVEQLRELLLVDEGDELSRLYPNAYPDDDELEADYREVVHDQLLMQRLDAIDVVASTLDAETLDAEQADAWLTTINQVRLVLGTRLDVSEDDTTIDPDHPDAGALVVYQLLSHVLDALIDARAALL